MTRPERVWVFDTNRRVYPPAEPGRRFASGPIWREHWRKIQIVGETSRSWIGSEGTRFPKKRPDGPRVRSYCISQAEVDAECWDHEHRYRIVRQVEQCDPRLLREVASLIGYKEKS